MDGSNNGRSSDDLHQRNTPPGDDEGSEMMMMDESKLLEEANKLVLSLQAAAKEGQEAKIIELLGKSPPGLLINTRDREAGLTALHVATRAGKDNAVACLLKHGASILVTDKGGLTALDYARVRNRQSCLNILKDHIKNQPPLLKEVGPLMSCFFEAPLDRELMAWALRYYGPDLLDIKGRDLCGPLHFAITNNDASLVEQLLDLGADPFCKDAEDRSPLDIARMTGNPAMVKAVSSVMRTQLLAFGGLAALFLLYRKGGDPQQPWFILAVVWPFIQTIQALCIGTKQALGEWLTYWAFLVPILTLEKAFSFIPSDIIERFFPSDKKHVVSAVLDLYMVLKIVFALYLIYPACRGSRKIYQRFFDPEEREIIQARRKRLQAEEEKRRKGGGTSSSSQQSKSKDD